MDHVITSAYVVCAVLAGMMSGGYCASSAKETYPVAEEEGTGYASVGRCTRVVSWLPTLVHKATWICPPVDGTTPALSRLIVRLERRQPNVGSDSSRIAMCVVELTPPPPLEVIPMVFCEVFDMSALTKRLPGGDVVSRITNSAPGGAEPVTDGVCEGVPVPEAEGETVREGEEPKETVGVLLAVGVLLGSAAVTAPT
jgi:hypothetical protein